VGSDYIYILSSQKVISITLAMAMLKYNTKYIPNYYFEKYG